MYTSLIRTLPLVPATQKSVQNNLSNRDTSLIRTLCGPSGVLNREVSLYQAPIKWQLLDIQSKLEYMYTVHVCWKHYYTTSLYMCLKRKRSLHEIQHTIITCNTYQRSSGFHETFLDLEIWAKAVPLLWYRGGRNHLLLLILILLTINSFMIPHFIFRRLKVNSSIVYITLLSGRSNIV